MLHHLTQHKPHSPFPSFYCYFLPVSSHYLAAKMLLLSFCCFKMPASTLPSPQLLQPMSFSSYAAFLRSTEPTSKKHYHSPLPLIVRQFVGFFWPKCYMRLNGFVLPETFPYRKQHKSYLTKFNERLPSGV